MPRFLLLNCPEAADMRRVFFANLLILGSFLICSHFKANSQVFPDDIASQGYNSWILHTPDDSIRNYLHLAPGTNSTSWQWSKGTVFYNSGLVQFPSNVEVKGKLDVKTKIIVNSGLRFNGYETGPGLELSGNKQYLHVEGAGIISRNNTQDLEITGWEFRHLKLVGDAYIGNKLTIGTTSGGSHRLAVEGSIGAREVTVEASGWSDFVFEEGYQLITIEELEKYIEQRKHLPEIPTEAEIAAEGIKLGEMNAKLLQKIEELTLYLIQQNSRIKQLEASIKDCNITANKE